MFGVSPIRRTAVVSHVGAVMEALLGWFGDQGVGRVDLNASADGQSLYRRLGFDDHPNPTLRLRSAVTGTGSR